MKYREVESISPQADVSAANVTARFVGGRQDRLHIQKALMAYPPLGRLNS